jgi:hypothetical protein
MAIDPAAAARTLAGQIQGGFGAQRAAGGTGGPFAGMAANPGMQRFENSPAGKALESIPGRIMNSPRMQQMQQNPIVQKLESAMSGRIPGGPAGGPAPVMPPVARPAAPVATPPIAMGPQPAAPAPAAMPVMNPVVRP